MTSARRIPWIDQARGWAMVLVMLGHAPFPSLPLRLVYAFHIPLFFLLSGWLFDPDRQGGWKPFLASRFRALVLPYAAFSLAGLAGVGLASRGDASTVGAAAWGALLGIRNSSVFNGTLWFVACLLATELLYYALHRATRGHQGLLGLVATLGLGLGLANPRLWGLFPPWSLDAAPIAMWFFALGRILRRNLGDGLPGSLWIPLGAALAWIAAGWAGTRIDFYTCRYGEPWLFLPAAIGGSILFLWTAQRIPKIAWIGFVGRTSLVFLALHEWLCFNLARVLFRSLGLPTSPEGWTAQLSTGIAFVLLALALLAPVARIVEARLPWLLGRRRPPRPLPVVPSP